MHQFRRWALGSGGRLHCHACADAFMFAFAGWIPADR